jgi:hypothetical protein
LEDRTPPEDGYSTVKSAVVADVEVSVDAIDPQPGDWIIDKSWHLVDDANRQFAPIYDARREPEFPTRMDLTTGKNDVRGYVVFDTGGIPAAKIMVK